MQTYLMAMAEYIPAVNSIKIWLDMMKVLRIETYKLNCMFPTTNVNPQKSQGKKKKNTEDFVHNLSPRPAARCLMSVFHQDTKVVSVVLFTVLTSLEK